MNKDETRRGSRHNVDVSRNTLISPMAARHAFALLTMAATHQRSTRPGPSATPRRPLEDALMTPLGYGREMGNLCIAAGPPLLTLHEDTGMG